MPNSQFAVYYWSHKCPATSPEDGDNVPSGYHDLKLTPLSTVERLRFKDETLRGKKCTESGCKYIINEETVLHNKDRQPIRNLGGKNLYPHRTTPRHMRCCNWRCRNANTMGHSIHNVNLGVLGSHGCSHTLIYQHAIQNYNISKRLDGCNCVRLNTYGEEVEYWEPQGRRGEPYPGGPLDLDMKYYEKKKIGRK